MKFINKNAGMTLIEILATVVILSIVMITLSSILMNGINFSNKVSNTNALQQHGNYVLAALQKQHEQGKPYDIIIDSQKIILHTYDDDGLKIIATQTIENTQFSYYMNEFDDSTESHTIKVDPLYERYLTIKILIKNSNGSPGEYEIQTTLSRL